MRQIIRLPNCMVLASAGAALLLAGCGGGAKPPITTGSNSADPGISSAYKYSQCMRQHGVTSFPDPKVVSTPQHQSVMIHITPGLTSSPAFATARKACNGILPGPGASNGGGSPQQIAARVKGLLGFARCMRSHHLSTFPDPTARGVLTLAMVHAAGIDLRAPAVQAAGKGCASASGGQITAAQVASAVNGGH